MLSFGDVGWPVLMKLLGPCKYWPIYNRLRHWLLKVKKNFVKRITAPSTFYFRNSNPSKHFQTLDKSTFNPMIKTFIKGSFSDSKNQCLWGTVHPSTDGWAAHP